VSFLLDTNVISEWVRPQPHPNVIAWLDAADEEQVYLSVISFAELRRGVDLLPVGRRRERLANWIAGDLAARFDGRIVDIDREVADAWGRLMARSQEAGWGMGSMDAFFAATADVHRLTLVTRNVSDFEHLDLPLCNPWEMP
jgi:predicted nucleic acid-binding protein